MLERMIMVLLTADPSAAETSAPEISQLLQETQPVAVQVQQDLQQLRPNAIWETLESWTPGILSLGYRLLIAALILLIGNRVAKAVRGMLKRTFQRMDADLSMSRFLISVADVMIYTIAFFMAADKLGIPSASIIALLGSAGLAIGLSLQESLGNVAGGILIMLTRPFVLHDYIIYGSVEGTVQSIGLVYTTLTTMDNKKVTIPNGSISNGIVVNVTAQEKRRVDIEVGIGYTSDMRKAKEILRHIYESHPLIIKEDGIAVYVGSLEDSAVMIGGRGWTRTEDYWDARWNIIEQIKVEFDRAGIEIPFNQMDIHISRGES